MAFFISKWGNLSDGVVLIFRLHIIRHLILDKVTYKLNVAEY